MTRSIHQFRIGQAGVSFTEKPGDKPLSVKIFGREWSDGMNPLAKTKITYCGWFYHIRFQDETERIVPEYQLGS